MFEITNISVRGQIIHKSLATFAQNKVIYYAKLLSHHLKQNSYYSGAINYYNG